MDPLINPRFLYKPVFGAYSQQSQAGRGFLSIFSKVLPFIKTAFKAILPAAKKAVSNPVVKRAANELKKQAIDAGLNVASDALQGENIGQSIKQNAIKAGTNTAQNLLDSAKASRRRSKDSSGASNPAPKKKKRKKTSSVTTSRKTSRKGRSIDLFDK